MAQFSNPSYRKRKNMTYRRKSNAIAEAHDELEESEPEEVKEPPTGEMIDGAFFKYLSPP
jgi:hypothetical protein